MVFVLQTTTGAEEIRNVSRILDSLSLRVLNTGKKIAAVISSWHLWSYTCWPMAWQ